MPRPSRTRSRRCSRSAGRSEETERLASRHASGVVRDHASGSAFATIPGSNPAKTCDDRLRAHRSQRSRAKREVGHPEPAQPETHAGISHAEGEVDDVVDRLEGGPQPACWMVAHEATVGEAAPAVRGRLALRSSRQCSCDALWTHPACPPLAVKTLLLNSVWIRKCPPLITWL